VGPLVSGVVLVAPVPPEPERPAPDPEAAALLAALERYSGTSAPREYVVDAFEAWRARWPR
jgi:hypothetical protein